MLPVLLRIPKPIFQLCIILLLRGCTGLNVFMTV